jgi:hypothetical protein
MKLNRQNLRFSINLSVEEFSKINIIFFKLLLFIFHLNQKSKINENVQKRRPAKRWGRRSDKTDTFGHREGGKG